mmetsp:Transcript_28898/g.57563  ORF Transcript_28898/g.57563 Transcript_28898/m.57563 type:complete len:162 (+) Transcript_28898:31-516(+)
MPITSDNDICTDIKSLPYVPAREKVGVSASIGSHPCRQSVEISGEKDLYHPCPDGETVEFVKLGDSYVGQLGPENRANTKQSRRVLDCIDQDCFGFEKKQVSYDSENDIESSPATTNSNLKKRVSFLFDSSEGKNTEQDSHETKDMDENLDFHEACFSCTS